MVTIDDGTEHGATGKTLLAALAGAGVLSVVRLEDGRFCFHEVCDRWFSANLTKEQVLSLADELRALACGA